jgi:hypothetical protein
MNHRALEDLLKEKVKLGGDAAVAAGPVGRNAQAATTVLANAEFLTYSRSRGLFAGIDLNGDVVHQNHKDTETVYGHSSPRTDPFRGRTDSSSRCAFRCHCESALPSRRSAQGCGQVKMRADEARALCAHCSVSAMSRVLSPLARSLAFPR